MLLLCLWCCLNPVALSHAASEDLEAQRTEIRDMASKVLTRLFEVQPTARQAIDNAAGYAVFSNFGMKLFFAGGGTGKGLLIDQTSKREVFMKMIEVQAGLGFGIKKFQLVMVFETPEVLEAFINSGWEAGAQATAAVQGEKRGGALQGAISISPGVWLYQLTQKGLALEATLKGTKYYKNDELNAPPAPAPVISP